MNCAAVYVRSTSSCQMEIINIVCTCAMTAVAGCLNLAPVIPPGSASATKKDEFVSLGRVSLTPCGMEQSGGGGIDGTKEVSEGKGCGGAKDEGTGLGGNNGG